MAGRIKPWDRSQFPASPAFLKYTYLLCICTFSAPSTFHNPNYGKNYIPADWLNWATICSVVSPSSLSSCQTIFVVLLLYPAK